MPRLIDADALVKYFEGLAVSLANVECFAAADAMQTAAETLKLAPTVDAEPVKRGRWMKSGMDVTGNAHVVPFTLARCSECNTEGSPMWKRCPVCEAKMGLEVQDEE